MPIRVPTDRPTVDISDTATPGGRCPADGQPLFPWIEGPDSAPGSERQHVVDRCESCHLAIEREDAGEALADLIEALSDRVAENGLAELEEPNGASFQAGIGAENWSELHFPERPYVLTPKALALLLEHEGLEAERLSYPARPGMGAMLQTLLNLITFNRNFAAEALHGRLGPSQSRHGTGGFLVDTLITVMVVIPAAVIAVALEGLAALVRRGGVMRASIRRRAR